jgi:hypothetical protein
LAFADEKLSEFNRSFTVVFKTNLSDLDVLEKFQLPFISPFEILQLVMLTPAVDLTSKLDEAIWTRSPASLHQMC